ncbi:hypothetical protein BGW38_006130 [Lunasporangiospora selenospora]|uniref:Uncharacterized protein n=1 Tax=Lunasporangiospora selenospora TaxID=979761 RepID=A0A9P6KAY2_9FUNG|nr:hypothetical protein BGW38_006130 [Lunasporangiospora selenospora]
MTNEQQTAQKIECDCKNRAEWDLHPLANRTFENLDKKHIHTQTEPCIEIQATTTKTKTMPACSCGKNEWDLHPATIRFIENEGTPQDVKQLHELERRCPRAEKPL